MELAHLGYCGMNCDACSVRRHGLSHATDAFIQCCGSVPESDLTCNGCKADVVYAGCQTCQIRACASTRKLTHCAECQDFPCPTFNKWKAAATILPHTKDALGNLNDIKQNGLNAWAETQRSRWSCPQCGTPFSWYATTCATCGRDLGGQTHAMSWLQKTICRIVLPMTYRKGKGTRNQAPRT